MPDALTARDRYHLKKYGSVDSPVRLAMKNGGSLAEHKEILLKQFQEGGSVESRKSIVGELYPEKTARELGLSDYYQRNPGVAGMATGGKGTLNGVSGDYAVSYNPYNKYMQDSQSRQALLDLERARGVQSDYNINDQPDPTQNQMEWIRGDKNNPSEYYKNPRAFAQSIDSRILVGDKVPNPTFEQYNSAYRLKNKIQDINSGIAFANGGNLYDRTNKNK